MSINVYFQHVRDALFFRIFSVFENKRRGIYAIYLYAGLPAAISYLINNKYINSKSHKERINKLSILRQKSRISVAFQVWNLSKWKCDSVFNAMTKSERFEPIIWITNQPNTSVQSCAVLKKELELYFKKRNYHFVIASTWSELEQFASPDITFIQEPYDFPINLPPNTNNRLLCYVRYGLPNTLTQEGTNFFLNNFTLFYFGENTIVATEFAEIMQNKGRNIVVTGHPIVDYLMEREEGMPSVWKKMGKERKKIIWAPHWTVEKQTFFSVSTFLSLADVMVSLAIKYKDSIQFAFKPHPNLYNALCSHSAWGKQKTDAYYEIWATMENSQLENGEYRNLFQQSDAIIHDCGSFILEYMLVGKPCMYLSQGDTEHLFNNMNLEALRCYTIGKTKEDIETFIQEQVIGDYDPHAEKRKAFCEKYLIPPHGKTAAENIIDAILGNPPYNQL